MKFNDIVGINEAKGAGSFDYKYWFWAKRGTSYGISYARQPIELDIQMKGSKALDALENLRQILAKTKAGEDLDLEVIEKKVKANTKRLSGIVDLFSSPIVVHWLNKEKTTTVTIPDMRDGDVTDSDGKHIDVISLFRDPDTQEFVTEVMDWEKVKINDTEGDTLNTMLAKFLSDIFGSDAKKSIRTYARGEGLESIMSTMSFKDPKTGVKVEPFKKTDYKILPEGARGSKKSVDELRKIIENNFAKLLKNAREAF